MEPDAELNLEQTNNRRSNQGVRNSISVITRSLIAMTNTDISYCAALVCSTERIQKRSRKFKSAFRNQYVTIQKRVIFCSGYSQATNSLATHSSLLQNTATNNKFNYIFYTQAGIMSYINFPFFFFISLTIQLQYYTKKQ